MEVRINLNEKVKFKLSERGELTRGIESLPTIEVSDDCISRQQAIEAIEGVDWYHVNSKGELVHGSTSDEESWYKAEDIYKAIESLPLVTPTERTGEWVFRTDIPIGGGAESAGYVCSECGADVNCPYNYCYNCGAKMGEMDNE